jgi:hypothetical protein
MKAIVRQFERLRGVNYERLFVVSVAVVTLVGSLYLYLVDFYLVSAGGKESVSDPEVAARLAPIGRVTLAEAVATEPAVAEPALPVTSVDEPAKPDTASNDLSVDAVPAEASESSVESAAVDRSVDPSVGAGTELGTESGGDLVTEASPGGSTAETMISSDSAEPMVDLDPDAAADATQASSPIVPTPVPVPGGAVPGYRPAHPGFAPIPGQGYAPIYPQYQAPPGVPQQAPGGQPWYGPYRQPYAAPSQYDRPSAPAPAYPPPQGWMR